jgi:hypothetical protein
VSAARFSFTAASLAGGMLLLVIKAQSAPPAVIGSPERLDWSG